MAGQSTSFTKVDLPEPLTPVMTVIVLRGKRTVRFLRLFCEAPFIIMELALLRRRVGTGMCILPVRYCVVRLFSQLIRLLMSPSKTTSPPNAPAIGPMSMM